MVHELAQALKSLQGFSALSDSALDQLLSFVSLRTVRAGETIFAQGEPSPFCFGVLSGEVVIQRVTKDSRFPTKILGSVGPGGLFGESSIFEEGARVAMASAAKDGKLAVIRGSQLREWVKKNPADSQPLLLALLQTSLGRLHRTSHELAVVYGIGRLLGSDKPFVGQLAAVLDFLKGSLDGLDDLVFYQRSPYWEEFAPVMSLPALSDLPSIPAQNDMVQKVKTAGSMQPFDPPAMEKVLGDLHLPWEKRQAIAVIPLFDWDKAADPLQGLLLIASARQSKDYLLEKQLLLTSVSLPLAEALSRHSRQEDAQAQARLRESKQSNPK